MRAITLMGMSGVGKTYMSRKLADWNWYSYSCDLAICRSLLNPRSSSGADDTTMLSVFLGKLGDPEKGGFPLERFKERQKMYYDEEVRSLEDIDDQIEQARQAGFKKFIHDSTGSFCEIEEDEVIAQVGQNSLIVYIKASEEDEQKILDRAQKYPKPLFFPPSQFEGWLQEYLNEQEFGGPEEMEPDEFARWVFPKLFHARLPKYQRIADEYGVTIPFAEFQNIQNEDDFNQLIERYEQNR